MDAMMACYAPQAINVGDLLSYLSLDGMPYKNYLPKELLKNVVLAYRNLVSSGDNQAT